MATGTEELVDVTAGLHVIDCDTHFQEPPDLWTSRVPAKYRDLMPQVRRVQADVDAIGTPTSITEGEVDKWFIGDKEFGGGVVVWVDPQGVKHRGAVPRRTFDQASPAAWNAKERLKLMDELGIWAQTVYPNTTGFSAVKAMTEIDDPVVRTLYIETYNDAIAEFQRESGDRIFPQAMLPIWDQKEMVKEARRAIDDLGLKGFVIGDRPELIGLPDYRDSHWEPLWEFCNDKQVPLNFHSANSSAIEANKAPWGSYGPQIKVSILTCLFSMANAACMANFLCSGLFDRYPNLQFVSVESGIGWIPFLLEHLEYQIDECVTDEFYGKRRPTDYYYEHFHTCFWFESFPLQDKQFLDRVGVKNVLFETDFPHPTCLYPHNKQHLNEVMSGLDEYTRRRILQDNAVELYHLPLPE